MNRQQLEEYAEKIRVKNEKLKEAIYYCLYVLESAPEVSTFLVTEAKKRSEKALKGE